MFAHTFKYTCLTLIRNKSNLFWCICFPLILGTMFYIAFHNLSSDEEFHAIPVAVVSEKTTYADQAKHIIDELAEEGEEQLLDVTYTQEKEARKLLEEKEIVGIIYLDQDIRLAVSDHMDSMKLEQSILESFITSFRLNYDAIVEAARTHPERIAEVMKISEEEAQYNTEVRFTTGDMDQMTTYFFSLLAMVCLYGGMSGCMLAISEKANLSNLGARKCLSPVNRIVNLLGSFSATLLIETICVMITLFYLKFVLGIEFGNEFGHTMFGVFAGCSVGISMGYFIGSIGHMKSRTKEALLMTVTMLCSFLSGLMVGNIRIYVEQVAPWMNKINPAALIADAFYALSIYKSHVRYWTNVGSLFGMSLLFLIGVFILTRRERYASI